MKFHHFNLSKFNPSRSFVTLGHEATELSDLERPQIQLKFQESTLGMK